MDATSRKHVTEVVSVADPFADEPTDTASFDTPNEPNNGVTLSYKGGTGYDASLFVLRASNMRELLELIGGDPRNLSNAEVLKAIFDLSAKHQAYRSGLNGSQKRAPAPESSGSTEQPVDSRPAPTDAPGGEERFCKHGKMTFRTGITKSGKNQGKTWQGFYCTERDKDNQCDVQWLPSK
jgi:hypothetical protein